MDINDSKYDIEKDPYGIASVKKSLYGAADRVNKVANTMHPQGDLADTAKAVYELGKYLQKVGVAINVFAAALTDKKIDTD